MPRYAKFDGDNVSMKTNETVQVTQAGLQGGAPYLAKLLYNWVNFGFLITI